MKHQFMKFGLISIGLLMGLAIATSPGCALSEAFGAGRTAPEQQAALQVEVDRLKSAVNHVDVGITNVLDTINDQQDFLDSLPDDDSLAGKVKEGIEVAQAKLIEFQSHKEELEAAIATTEGAIAGINTDGDGISATMQAGGGAVEAVGGFLPPPWNTIAILAGGVLAGFGEHRARKYKKDLVNTVFAMDVGKRKSTNMANGMNEVGGDIMSAMGVDTSGRIDKIRKTG